MAHLSPPFITDEQQKYIVILQLLLVLRYLSLTKDISISMLQHSKPHTVMEGKYHSNIKHFVST